MGNYVNNINQQEIAVPHPTETLSVHCFQIELGFGSVGFCGGRKTGEPEVLGASMRSNNKVNPLTTADPGIEPGLH